MIYAAEDTMRNVADYLNNPQILQSIKKIMESNEALKHEMEAIRREQVAEWAAKIVDSTPERGGMRLMLRRPIAGRISSRTSLSPCVRVRRISYW